MPPGWGASGQKLWGEKAMKHFTTEDWIDFANELVAGSKREDMERHLNEGCERCQKTAELWQKIRQTANSAASCEPPISAVRIAKAAFTRVPTRESDEAKPRLVEVLFDSFLQPLAQGARSSDSGARQMLYRAEPYQVDVQIEAKPAANKLIVTGQLFDMRHPEVPSANIPVVISNLRGNVVQTVTNEFGEFREEINASSDLELKLLGDDEKAVILSLRNALGATNKDVV
jgi:hypothetical protein